MTVIIIVIKTSFSHKKQVKCAEIKLAVSNLISLLQNIFNDFKIAHDFSVGRSTCTNIVKNKAKRETEKLISILQNYKFSIFIDETIDIADTKIICSCTIYIIFG